MVTWDMSAIMMKEYTIENTASCMWCMHSSWIFLNLTLVKLSVLLLNYRYNLLSIFKNPKKETNQRKEKTLGIIIIVSMLSMIVCEHMASDLQNIWSYRWSH